MRLIDADKLKRYIDDCDFCDRCSDASPRCQIDCEMPDFLTKRWERVIDVQPTVDAIPVEWLKENYPTNGVYGPERYFRTAHAVEDVLKAWELEKEKRKDEWVI